MSSVICIQDKNHRYIFIVSKNRSIVSEIFYGLKFSVTHKLGILGHGERDDFVDRGVFRDFLSLL